MWAWLSHKSVVCILIAGINYLYHFAFYGIPRYVYKVMFTKIITMPRFSILRASEMNMTDVKVQDNKEAESREMVSKF